MRSRGRTPSVSEAELHQYVDGELDRERQNVVQAYLFVSPVDSARVERWRRQNEALRATFPPLDAGQWPWPPPGNLRARCHGRLQERWISYPVALAFVFGAFLSGSVVFVAARLNLLQVAAPSILVVTPAAGNNSLAEQAMASPREAKTDGCSVADETGHRGPEALAMPAIGLSGAALAR